MAAWHSTKETFQVMDVRNARKNFLPGLLKKARGLKIGEGLHIIQTFEPIPLYSAMEELGFEYVTESQGPEEFHTWFCRKAMGESTYPDTGDTPLKPTAILNFKNVDPALAAQAVGFWNLVWNKKEPALELKTKLLLSLANGVGAGRFRQATREMIKAYALGTTVEELDEVFTLLAWNGGMGTFASEIGPSPLYGAYQRIKDMTLQGKERQEIVAILLEGFGEKNPQVSVDRS